MTCLSILTTSNSWMSSPWLNPFLTLIERPFSGANALLAKAFLQCQWEIVTLIDIEIDHNLDVSRPAIRRAIHEVLPQVVLISGAMSCAAKSQAPEKKPGPPPLYGVRSHPESFRVCHA